MNNDFAARLERISARPNGGPDNQPKAQWRRLGLVRIAAVCMPLMVIGAFARRSTEAYLAIADTTPEDLAAVLPAALFLLALIPGSLVAVFGFRRWPAFACAMAACWIGYGTVYRLTGVLALG